MSVRYRPRPPETYPNDTLVGGTFLIGEMEQAYCFIVDIHGLIPSLDEAANRAGGRKAFEQDPGHSRR